MLKQFNEARAFLAAFAAPRRLSEPGAVELSASLYVEAWRRLKQNRIACVSLIFLVLMALACFTGEYFLQSKWDEINFVLEATPPSFEHWFGIDDLGRDLLARVLYGGKISLSVGLISTTVSMLIGISYGAIAGYFGGWTDRLMMRFVDFLYSLPYYFIIVLIMVFFSVSSIYLLFIILALFQWLGMARLVRGQILSLKERDFVLALRSCGASHTRIIFQHLIPNTLGLVAVYATLTVPSVMMQEAFLSFIGIPFQVIGSDGIQKPVASWGTLISEGSRVFETGPWLLAFPSLFFCLTLLAINFLGDGLRDALDPNMKV